jgi:hypothetical protein
MANAVGKIPFALTGRAFAEHYTNAMLKYEA